MAKTKLVITPMIIIMLVVGIYLGMSYLREQKEHTALKLQITDITQALEQIPAPPQDLEQRLATAQAELSTEQNNFPDKINSTDLINAILKLAETSKIKAIPLKTQPWSTETVKEHDYHVFRINIVAVGRFSQLMTFASQLEKGGFRTLILENISVTRLSTESPEGTAPDGDAHVAADLALAIYTQSSISD